MTDTDSRDHRTTGEPFDEPRARGERAWGWLVRPRLGHVDPAEEERRAEK
jgi:hypothetical protein